MTQHARVVVIGGGIGGLCASIALAQKGLSVTVCERAEALRPVGAGLTIQPNAMQALERLGLAGAVRDVGRASRPGAMALYTRHGQPLMALRPDDAAWEGYEVVGVHRGALQSVLLSACEGAGVEVKTGMTFASYTDDNDGGVTARFEGGERVEAEALIGADGIHSKVRAQVLGDTSPLMYSGYTVWRGVVTSPDADVEGEIWGRGMRFGIVPLGQGQTYWFATANAPEGERDAPGGSKAALLERFGGWMAPVEALIQATPEESIMRHDIHDRAPVKRWGRGRVTLLGDAAHPMTPNLGQGACQAIEDAVALGEAAGRADSLTDALRAYERARIERANWFVERSRASGRMGQWANPALCALRDTVVRWTPASWVQGSLHTMWNFAVEGASKPPRGARA